MSRRAWRKSCTNAHYQRGTRAKPGSVRHAAGRSWMCHSGWALGVGRRLLDELATLAQSKTGRPGSAVDSDSFVEQFAKAEASMRAARAFVREAWTDVAETCVDRNEHASVRQHTLVRLALTNVTQVLHEVSTFVYLSAGTTGVAQRHSPASLPRRARRHPARDFVAPCRSELRPRTGRTGFGHGLAVPRSRPHRVNHRRRHWYQGGFHE